MSPPPSDSVAPNDWQRVLAAWEALARPEVTRAPDTREFAYRITGLHTRTAHGVEIVVAKLRRLSKNKEVMGYVQATSAWVAAVVDSDEYPISPLDRELFEAMLPRGHRRLTAPKVAVSDDAARLILRLANHDRVVDEDGVALRIRKAHVSLRLKRTRPGFAQYELCHGEAPIVIEGRFDRLDIAERARLGRDLLTWDRENRTLWIGRVPPTLARIELSAAEAFDEFPESALPALVAHLPSLSSRVQVDVDDGLIARTDRIAGALRVRIERAAVGVRVRIVALPEGAAAAYTPGVGPRLSYSADAQGVRIIERDPRAEVAQARELAKRLHLGELDARENFVWATEDLPLMLELVERLREINEVVEWIESKPPTIHRAYARHASVRVSESRDWFALGGEVVIDDATLPLDVLLEAIRDKHRAVRVEGDTWVLLDDRLRAAFAPLARVADSGHGGRLSSIHAVLLGNLRAAGVSIDAPQAFGASATAIEAAATMDPPLPAGFEATLRPYQVTGFVWLSRLATWAPGACLADDMGLGKTLQALAFLASRMEGGAALVVVPTSLTHNWVREAERFAPALRVHRWLAKPSGSPAQYNVPGSVVVVSHDLLVLNIEAFATQRWHTLVVDEAQAVKNAQTQRAQAMMALPADFKLAITGTPIENRTVELWSLFELIVPGFLGTHDHFQKRFVGPIERLRDDEARTTLAGLIRPFMLRRLKSDVAPELPAKIEKTVDIELTDVERAVYDQVRAAALAEINKRKSLKSNSAQQTTRFLILSALMRMRQAACHARLLMPQTPTISSKQAALLDILDELRAEGRQALVFSQFTSLLDMIEPSLVAHGLSHGRLDGSTVPGERQRLVDAFQRGEFGVFLLSLKAGGTGLNLTAAETVIHLDPWWNPAVEDQATDRAHRIGQSRSVQVIRLVTRGTIEEGIMAMHANKRELVDAMLDGTDGAAALGVDELLALIG